MALLDSTLNPRHPLESLNGAVITGLRIVSSWIAARRHYRTVRNELLEYSPQELAELGIRDEEIDFVAHAAMSDQQTNRSLR